MAHLLEALGRVGIDLGRQFPLENREQVLDEDAAPGHPLVVGTTTVVVGPVEPRPRKAVDEPAKESFVSDMHTQRDLGLLPVSTERPLSDKQTNQKPPVEIR